MCNSVFINFLANCLSIAINKINVSIEPNAHKLVSLNHSVIDRQIRLGSLQTGQAQNLILKATINDPKEVNIPLKIQFENGKELEYIISQVNEQENKKICFNEELSNEQLRHLLFSSSNEFPFQIVKCWLIKIINDAISSCNLKRAMKQLDLLYENIENMISLCSEEETITKLNSLLKDIKSGETNSGQLYKSLENESWFKRWGVHYLKYFARSHQLQNSSNFKDFSLQNYGSEFFKLKKSNIEDTFSQIPVPKPSKKLEKQPNSSVNFESFQKTFYSAVGGKIKKQNVFFLNFLFLKGCVDGLGKISTKEGVKQVKDLVKGDVLINSDGKESTILCVLKRKIDGGVMDMLSFNNLKITPWHPIRINKKWEFPVNLAGYPLKINCDFVYNFVLSDHHFISINSIDVITLGHNFTEDPVLNHPFFGTQKVIDQLKSHPSWESGLIMYEYNPSFDKNGLVSSLW